MVGTSSFTNCTSIDNYLYVGGLLVILFKHSMCQLLGYGSSINGNNAAEGIQRYNLETSIDIF